VAEPTINGAGKAIVSGAAVATGANRAADLAVHVAEKIKLPADQVSIGGDRKTLEARIKAAFDKRDKAQAIITSRMMQLYVGWNSKNDAAYQQAIKDRAAANAEIDSYRKIAPDLVKAEEARRSWGGRINSFFSKLWGGFKSFVESVPWTPMWGPFIPRTKDQRPPVTLI
jgi:hypothetical protein